MLFSNSFVANQICLGPENEGGASCHETVECLECSYTVGFSAKFVFVRISQNLFRKKRRIVFS